MRFDHQDLAACTCLSSTARQEACPVGMSTLNRSVECTSMPAHARPPNPDPAIIFCHFDAAHMQLCPRRIRGLLARRHAATTIHGAMEPITTTSTSSSSAGAVALMPKPRAFGKGKAPLFSLPALITVQKLWRRGCPVLDLQKIAVL